VPAVPFACCTGTTLLQAPQPSPCVWPATPTQLLHSRGVDLVRAEFVPDCKRDIVDTVLRLRERVGPDGFVFTSGGIGETSLLCQALAMSETGHGLLCGFDITAAASSMAAGPTAQRHPPAPHLHLLNKHDFQLGLASCPCHPSQTLQDPPTTTSRMPVLPLHSVPTCTCTSPLLTSWCSTTASGTSS
jgi:hypothetical protein